MDDEVAVQREYYRRTAEEYHNKQLQSVGEHDFARAFMLSMIGFLGVRSVLDIGCGTGRGMQQIKAAYPEVKVIGIEPADGMREIGYQEGLSREELIDGDAQKIAFGDGEFDLVCEFGALHHMPDPHKAVREMLRVSRKAIFISDGNNFGQGGAAGRTVKQMLRALHLWKAADFVKTRGKGYAISEGDGLYYSYSVFDDYAQIAKACKSVHLMNSTAAGANLYRTATHIALLGVK